MSEKLHVERGKESRVSSERNNTRIPPEGRQFHFTIKPQITDGNMEKLGMGSQGASHWKKYTYKPNKNHYKNVSRYVTI